MMVITTKSSTNVNALASALFGFLIAFLLSLIYKSKT